MKKNIITILKSGNQELFYSSFIAWLLDGEGQHGLNCQFAHLFLNKIGLPEESIKSGGIETEKRVGSGRADIFITTKNGVTIIIENKTKSLGNSFQIEKYKHDAQWVIPLGFVKENFSELKSNQKTITYNDILDALKSFKIDTKMPFANLTSEFLEYLDSVLLPFDVFDKFCNNRLGFNELKEKLSGLEFIDNNDNDIRFFQTVYFYRLKEYIHKNAQSLVWSDSDQYYDQSKTSNATSWIIEKNKQGPAFMEAIIYKPEIPGKIRISEKWRQIYQKSKQPELSPRIELWWPNGSKESLLDKETKVGIFQIGTWDQDLKDAFLPDKSFNKRGSRNFHHRDLTIEDLQYSNIIRIIIEEMSKVWDFL